jgi:plasmid stabilization system protein ParE
MTRWTLGPAAGADLVRVTEFLLETYPEYAIDTSDIVVGALETLAAHPKIGRPVRKGLRELVISRGSTGYVALYLYDEAQDIAVVLRIRHQPERGYPKL